ncbi:MAG: hypothetical protein R2939_07955 [Kofleriaceae bacterium]
MATKAQAFRTEQARNAKPPRPKQPKRPRRDLVVDTAKPGVSASDRKARRAPTANAAAKGEGAALEVSAGRPSRKSTRKSADGTKRTTNQQLRARQAAAAPSSRAKATPKARGKVGASGRAKARR